MPETFPIRPQVFCDSCDRAMPYVKANGGFYLQHPASEFCHRSMQKFTAPMVTIYPIEVNEEALA